MLTEIDDKSKIAYFYSKDELEVTDCFWKERVDGVNIYKTYHNENIVVVSNSMCIEDALKKLKCKCGKELVFTQINRLPEEGWEELVDHWSCHNSEFSGMLKLQPKPRKNGVLYSHFYMLANSEELCCYGKANNMKVFLNDILSASMDKLIFTFFKQLFENKNVFLFAVRNVSYQVNFFNFTVVLKDKIYYKAVKIGYKKTNKIVPASENLNEHISECILDMLERNNTGIAISNLQLSFIY